jgi:hypothetical protein
MFPAMTPRAVCDLVKALRHNKPLEEIDKTRASATVKEQ